MLRLNDFQHLAKERVRAGQNARLHQCRCDGQVGTGFISALRDGPDAMADFETDVPKTGDKARQRFFAAVRQGFRE